MATVVIFFISASLTALGASESNMSIHCPACHQPLWTVVSGRLYSFQCHFECVDSGSIRIKFKADNQPVHDSSVLSGYMNVSSMTDLGSGRCSLLLTLVGRMADNGIKLKCTAAYSDDNISESRPIPLRVQGLPILDIL